MLDIIITLISGISFVILSASPPQNFPPPLGAARERECFRMMREEGSEDARCELIEHNLRLVSHIVRKYYSSSERGDDILSIGTVGLIKAVDTFDERNGARLATYAGKCIQNEILMHFRQKKKENLEVSIDDAIDTDRDGNPLTYLDIIKCDDTIADDIDRRITAAKAVRYIHENLSPREREIMILRYGLDGGDPITQRETAEKLGISRSYVSRIEKAALERLSAHLH